MSAHTAATQPTLVSMGLRLSEAASMAGGRLLGADANVTQVVSDSRQVQAGQLFVALRGERFDGHDFVDAVLQAGAAALVDEEQASRFAGKAVIAVSDTMAALGRLAQNWRQRFTGPVVMVVGSNGKTTVKEMIAAVLRAHHGEAAVHATQGNLNNAIGVPLTLLQLRGNHRAAVIEVGMNHRGETAALAAWVAPDVLLINNAQREHQEFMKSVEEVAYEHGDALPALRLNGCVVLNADDIYCGLWRTLASKASQQGQTTYSFGMQEHADLRGTFDFDAQGSDITLHEKQSSTAPMAFRLPLPGQAMAMNALAALAVTHQVGVPLAEGAAALAAFRAVAGRLNVTPLNAQWTLIDDTYNANPDSVRAGIDALAHYPGQRWLALGDMAEVGEDGALFHHEIGAYAKVKGVERLFTLGALSRHAQEAFGDGGAHFATAEELSAAVSSALREAPGQGAGTLLVKGSRSMRMERVVVQVRETSHADKKAQLADAGSMNETR